MRSGQLAAQNKRIPQRGRVGSVVVNIAVASFLFLTFLFFSQSVLAADNYPMLSNSVQTGTDSDGVGDVCDNYQLESNSDQRDFNADGYGKRCDADADLNGDEFVTAADYLILRSKLNQPPGPSGVIP